MSKIIKYSAVNTKIKAMKGKFLSKEQYHKLLSATSFKEAIRILRDETHYSELFNNMAIDNIRRGQFEVILKRYHIERLYKLSHYFNGQYKKLIELLFMRYEVEDLKVIIRSKYINRPKEDIEEMISFKNPLNTIDYDYLLSSASLKELIERLKGTIYYKYVKNFREMDSNEGLFRLENYLDIAYFRALRSFVKKLPKEDRIIIQNITGFEADLLNISSIYRGRIYYNIPPAEMYNYTIYDSYKLKHESLKALCYANGSEEIKAIINKLPYKGVIPYDQNEEYMIKVYQRDIMNKFFSRYMAAGKLDISLMMSYVYLLHIEVQNIVSIVENTRYEGEFAEITNYLIRTL